MVQPNISDSAVRRLSLYLRSLRDLDGQGIEFVSSRQLAEGSGTTPAQVRKDLSLFGSFGKRGRGYKVPELSTRLERILGLDRRWRVALVGVGRIGTALLGYRALARRGFEVLVAFDVADEKVGRRVHGVPVLPVSELERQVAERGLEIGIIATPPEAAPEIAARLAGSGLGAILNFAPVKLAPPEGVTVRAMDVVLELEGLSYHLVAEEREDA